MQWLSKVTITHQPNHKIKRLRTHLKNIKLSDTNRVIFSNKNSI